MRPRRLGGAKSVAPICAFLENSAKGSIRLNSKTMLPFRYRCPDCGWHAEILTAEVGSNERDHYESAVCPNCQQLHSVNTANGQILVEDELGDPW